MVVFMLKLLLQLRPGIVKIAFGHNMVTIEDNESCAQRSSLYFLWNSSTDHVPHCCSTKIME